MFIPFCKLFYLELAVNHLPIFITLCLSFSPLAYLFSMVEDSTTAWKAGAACAIITNLWLLSVLSQPWQFLLYTCLLHQGTEKTLCQISA